jgi:DNA invertase Pin-like site-specific DNA recombinase
VGKYRGGRFKLTPKNVADLHKRAAAGVNKAALAVEFGISRQCLYSYLQTADTTE